MSNIKEYIDAMKKNAYELSAKATEPDELEAVAKLSTQLDLTEAIFKETKNIKET